MRYNHVGEIARVISNLLDVENDDRARGVVDQVDDVVQRGRHHVDVFAVERRDERLVQTSRNVVCQFVAGVLEPLDSLGILLVVTVLVGQHLLQLARGRRDVERHLREQIKILIFFWKEA